jgi:hypothetical protein
MIELLEDYPSLKPYLEEALCKAYLKGVELAASETNVSNHTFPPEFPYSLAEIFRQSLYTLAK